MHTSLPPALRTGRCRIQLWGQGYNAEVSGNSQQRRRTDGQAARRLILRPFATQGGLAAAESAPSGLRQKSLTASAASSLVGCPALGCPALRCPARSGLRHLSAPGRPLLARPACQSRLPEQDARVACQSRMPSASPAVPASPGKEPTEDDGPGSRFKCSAGPLRVLR